MNATSFTNPSVQTMAAEFQLPEYICYLNCASKSPMARRVEQAGIDAFRTKRLPYEVSNQDFYGIPKLLREEFANLINCPNPERVAIIPSVSYGIAQVANNVKTKEGEEIILAAEQFPSDVYVWQKLADKTGAIIKFVSPPDSSTERGKAWNQAILNAIGPKTALVCIGNIHWTDGTIFDLAAIRKRTREHQALLIVDGTQSVGVMPMDVESLQPDALICAGYKWLMGPYSIGLGYYGEAFDEGEPIEENWKNRLGSENFADLVNYQPQYKDFAIRYEVGESTNFFLAPIQTEALKMINETGPLNIHEHCREISTNFIQEIQQDGAWMENSADRAAHLFGVKLPAGTDIKALKVLLEKEHVFVSVRGNFIRIAPHVYNTEALFQKLLTSIRTIL